MFSVDMLVRDKLQNGQQLMPVLGTVRIPLKCAISGKRMLHPACTSACVHPERVELSLFFERVVETQKWACPVCGVTTSYAGVLIDKLLREIIVDLGPRDIDEVTVYTTHEWEAVKKLTDTHVLMQQVFKLRADKSHILGQKEAAITDTYLTKKRSDNPMVVFRTKSMSMRSSSLITKTPALRANARVKRKSYTASTAYWFPWNEPFVYRYNFEEMAFDRILTIYNISFTLLQSTVVYDEATLYSIGGVSHAYYSQATVMQMSEEMGVKRCGAMKTPRHSFPAVIINDEIFVFGGLSRPEPKAEVREELLQGRFIDSCEKMSTSTETWEPIAEMSEPKAACSAVVLSRAIFVIGGSTDQIPYSSEIERYTPMDNKWSVIRVKLPFGLVNSLAFGLPNRPAFLIIGGYGDSATGKDVFLVNVLENSVMRDLEKLKTEIIDVTQFPLMFDHMSNVIHMLTGDGERSPVNHTFYNIDNLMRAIPESEDVGSPPTKNSQFVTPSTKSEINA